MKAVVNDEVKILMDVPSEFRNRIIPQGTFGVVVECYKDPEGYAVDLAIPDERLVGGYSYDNVYLTPDQFEVINAAPPKRSDHMHLESGQEVPPRHFGKHR